MTNIEYRNRETERGNVLFLILIAVALFAALSYAVTQSTRSGSGDASGETNLINSAQLAQYPAGVRTSVVRMVIGGISVDQLVFDGPTNFGVISDLRYAVFHPQGGGPYSNAHPRNCWIKVLQEAGFFHLSIKLTESVRPMWRIPVLMKLSPSCPACRRIFAAV